MSPRLLCRAVPARLRGPLLVAGSALATLSAGSVVTIHPERHLQLLASGTSTAAGLGLHPGDTAYLVNDADGVVHHPYIRAAGYSYDDGDLAPGQDGTLRFPVAGRFVLRCGIHPRLRVPITVE